jgi:hypothetical protein
MTKNELELNTRQVIAKTLYDPHKDSTAKRLKHFFNIARENLSLAKLCEAHWDALAILSEAGFDIKDNELYGVWASEGPDRNLTIAEVNGKLYLNGIKMFCSGAGIVDRALITAYYESPVIIDLNLKNIYDQLEITTDLWCTQAFEKTNTASIVFKNILVDKKDIIGKDDWYVKRNGFWGGALGPAACWGGGAAGLLDYAQDNKRNDPHTLAHLGAIAANIWAIESYLVSAGNEIDNNKLDAKALISLALKIRHLIEVSSTDTLRRFARAYGPFPLACVQDISVRYQELDLFLRQSHAERDLEVLGKNLKMKEH